MALLTRLVRVTRDLSSVPRMYSVMLVSLPTSCFLLLRDVLCQEHTYFVLETYPLDRGLSDEMEEDS